MTWRQAGWMILFYPVVIGVLVFFGPQLVCKMPMFCCARLRAVRYLPLAGLCYTAAVVTVAAVSFRLVWWEALVFGGFVVLGGGWLLPGPVSFFVRPAQRRAVIRAIEFIEQQGGPRAHYNTVALIGSEPTRQVVSVAVDSGFNTLDCRFMAVGADGGVEELRLGFVLATYHLRPWF